MKGLLSSPWCQPEVVPQHLRHSNNRQASDQNHVLAMAVASTHKSGAHTDKSTLVLSLPNAMAHRRSS